MKNNKIPLILCSVFAVLTVVFGVLAAVNFLKPDLKAEMESKAAEYAAPQVEKIDALADTLGNVLSKDMKEQTSYPQGIRKEFMQAYAVNNNLVGWLSIPGTEIDTALLQSNDNSKYLYKDFYERGTSNTTSTNYGNLYLDYRCITNDLSVNTVIHGHTTGKGDGIPKQAFRSLYDYRDMQTFIKNPIIKYSTLYEEYTFKICAVFLSSTQPKDDNGYFFTVIEFQPSGYAKGFYLNIALHFLWNERDSLSFDFPSGTGVRLGNFIEYHDDLQFCRELSQAIKKALEQVMFYRTFRDMQVIKRYAKKWTDSDLDAFRHLDTQDVLEKIRRTRAYWRSKPSMKKLSHHTVYD